MPSPKALFRVNARRFVALFSSLLVAVFIGVVAFSPFVVAPKNAYAESGTVSNLGSGSGLDRIAHPELESGADPNPHCGLFDFGCATVEALTGLLDVVVQGINLLLIGLLAMISFLFDWVCIEFVIGMGKYATSPEAQGIRAAWTLIRDLANIGIIGGLVATAIGTILGNDKYNVNKTLARIILAALLVNFSYFFAGALIDASNFVAKEAFKTIYRDNCTVANQCGPASRFLTATRLDDTIASLNSADEPVVTLNGEQRDSNVALTQAASNSQSSPSNAHKLVFHIMQSIFIMVTSFVFLSSIALLIARFISLLFLLITSPIGIAGTAVPILQSYASEWWKALRSQALFAPVYFLLVGISLNILDAIRGGLLNTGQVSGSAATATGIISMFIIAIGFMWAALSIAKSMSAEAKWFSDIYKQAGNALGWLPGTYTGTLRRAAVESVGRGSDFALERWNRFISKEGGSRFGDAARAVFKYGGVDTAMKAGLGGLAKSKFGGGKNAESYEEARHRRHARHAELDLTGQREKARKDLREAVPDAQKAREDYENLINGIDPNDKKTKLAYKGDQDNNNLEKEKPREKARKGETAAERTARDARNVKIDQENAEIRARNAVREKINKDTMDAYKKYMASRAQVEKAFSNLPPEGYEDIKKRNPHEFEKLAFYLPSSEFNRLIHDKEIPKNIRDHMKHERFSPVLKLWEEGEKLLINPDGKKITKAQLEAAARSPDAAVKADAETRLAAYSSLQSNLFAAFKRQAVDKNDLDALIAFKPEISESEFVMDGGLPHGWKMGVQDSKELGTAQKRVAKETWRATVRDIVAQSDRGGGAPFKGRTWKDVDVSSPNFNEATKRMQRYFLGKQPDEVAKQVSDNAVWSPVFAAAASIEAIKEIPRAKDPPFVQGLVENIVRLRRNPNWGTPEDRARLKAITKWMQENMEGQSLYGGYLDAAISNTSDPELGPLPDD